MYLFPLSTWEETSLKNLIHILSPPGKQQERSVMIASAMESHWFIPKRVWWKLRLRCVFLSAWTQELSFIPFLGKTPDDLAPWIWPSYSSMTNLEGNWVRRQWGKMSIVKGKSCRGRKRNKKLHSTNQLKHLPEWDFLHGASEYYSFWC